MFRLEKLFALWSHIKCMSQNSNKHLILTSWKIITFTSPHLWNMCFKNIYILQYLIFFVFHIIFILLFYMKYNFIPYYFFDGILYAIYLRCIVQYSSMNFLIMNYVVSLFYFFPLKCCNPLIFLIITLLVCKLYALIILQYICLWCKYSSIALYW